MFEEVKAIIVDTLNCEEDKVTLEANIFDDLGADSLDAMELNLALEEKLGKTISDEQMAAAAERFPVNPPRNKEEYCYRTIFEEHFPSRSAALSVPSVPSVACSSAVALEWDAAFRNMNDPSGRAVAGVHNDAY